MSKQTRKNIKKYNNEIKHIKRVRREYNKNPIVSLSPNGKVDRFVYGNEMAELLMQKNPEVADGRLNLRLNESKFIMKPNRY